MNPFVLSGGLIDTLETVGSNVATGNMANIGALAGLIVVVVTIAFGKGLIYKGLRRIGF